MKNNILIATEPLDPHADAVILRMRENGLNPLRLHTEDVLAKSGFSYDFIDGVQNGEIWTRKESVPIESIRSIWWRRPKLPVTDPSRPKDESRFIKYEVEHALNGLLATLDCYWMSDPAKIRAAKWKPLQLTRAVSLGFKVPDTIVSRDPQKILEFCDHCKGDVIFKVLSDGALGRQFASQGTLSYIEGDEAKVNYLRSFKDASGIKMVYCTPVSRGFIQENAESIRTTVCLFQRRIKKRFEYRVTVIGKKVFSALIDSQTNERTKEDWRHYDVPMHFKRASLPYDIELKCLKLVESFGLHFSAIDLIEDENGDFIFLESNPNGQWLFVERLMPEFKMIDTLIDCLVQAQ